MNATPNTCCSPPGSCSTTACNPRLAGLQILAASPLADDPESWPAFRLQARGYVAAFGNPVALIDAQRRTRLHTMVPLGDEPPPAPKPTGRLAVALAL